MADQLDKMVKDMVEQARKEGFRQGVEMAASVADEYNRSTIHPCRLGDCILGKLNMRAEKPRKNKERIIQHDNGTNFVPKGKKTVCADGVVY